MKSCLKLTVKEISVFILFILALTLNSGCGDAATQPAKIETAVASVAKVPEPVAPPTVMADAATILSRTEVPILCYHQVRDYKPSDSKTAKDYIVPVDAFREQMKLLADSGYSTILPGQLHEYLVAGKQLPAKSVLITFDDTRLDQYTAALPELNKYGFKAAFFIMTVSLGKPGYMSKEQVKQLADEGHTIGSHTYDHKNVKTYTVDDWVEQVQKPSQQLQTITGKPVEYFAYPFGLWNKDAIVKLKDHDFKAVFQLSARRDENDPMYSIRRIIVPGSWSGATMLRVMKNSFK
ncbi:MAG TPA: polysaccharide deacetylase family protein [Chitinophagaceae bacterium]|nr:polysaccharide deacetylase family protein [Chitinophagaceae bacterium]